MHKHFINGIIFLFLLQGTVCAQNKDSTMDNLKTLSPKYITGIDKKITIYSNRIAGKTTKTLTRLSKWENKIKGLLQKADPQAAERLFGNNQLTFTMLLQEFRQGEAIKLQAQAPYDKYRDDITTSLKYVTQQKGQLDSNIIKKAVATSSKMKQLNIEEDNTEAIQQFIKTRKKQLMVQALQQAGSSKYLAKINKESFYYTETLKNYKELFNDSKKAEETGKELLNKIPAFQQFMARNSMLAAMFGGSSASGAPTAAGNLAGLQTRASVQTLIQDRLGSGGPNAAQAFHENIEQAQAELGKLKDKLANAPLGAGSGDGEMPDFVPTNITKTKTFAQRIKYGTNLQFSHSNSLMPGTSDIGLSIGYKVNDKSVVGIGGSYKMGMGTIDRIRFTNQGASLRSYTDWQLNKLFYISGGFEMNYNSAFKDIEQLNQYDSWQRSALLGVSKKYKIGKKIQGETKLLFDFFANQHIPVTQPFIFRMGYNWK